MCFFKLFYFHDMLSVRLFNLSQVLFDHTVFPFTESSMSFVEIISFCLGQDLKHDGSLFSRLDFVLILD